MLVFSEPTCFSVGREEVRSQKTVQVAITSDRHLQMKLDRRCSAIYYIFYFCVADTSFSNLKYSLQLTDG